MRDGDTRKGFTDVCKYLSEYGVYLVENHLSFVRMRVIWQYGHWERYDMPNSGVWFGNLLIGNNIWHLGKISYFLFQKVTLVKPVMNAVCTIASAQNVQKCGF